MTDKGTKSPYIDIPDGWHSDGVVTKRLDGVTIVDDPKLYIAAPAANSYWGVDLANSTLHSHTASSVLSSDTGKCVVVAKDLIVKNPADRDLPEAGMSLTEEIEKLHTRIDQLDEKSEMVLDRLDELLNLLKGTKKG